MARSVAESPGPGDAARALRGHGAAAPVRERGAGRLPRAARRRGSCISTSARRRPASASAPTCGRTDWVTSTHRGHGHALAKGADPRRVMAELFGKADGICGGRGGTMHLYDRSRRALRDQRHRRRRHRARGRHRAWRRGRRGSDDIGVAFFGDGASNHGAFHEALNFAAVQRAPAVFVCENNLYATATPLRSVTLNPEIATRAASYGMPGVAVDGNDVLAVWTAMREAIERARARRRADADRGQDLPHRRPPRGRPGHRHLPDAGGGRRLGEARPGRDVPPAARRGVPAPRACRS